MNNAIVTNALNSYIDNYVRGDIAAYERDLQVMRQYGGLEDLIHVASTHLTLLRQARRSIAEIDEQITQGGIEPRRVDHMLAYREAQVVEYWMWNTLLDHIGNSKTSKDYGVMHVTRGR